MRMVAYPSICPELGSVTPPASARWCGYGRSRIRPVGRSNCSTRRRSCGEYLSSAASSSTSTFLVSLGPVRRWANRLRILIEQGAPTADEFLSRIQGMTDAARSQLDIDALFSELLDRVWAPLQV